MKNYSLSMLLIAAVTSGTVSAASFSYEGLSYTSPTCTTRFTMDVNGRISCLTSNAATNNTTTNVDQCAAQGLTRKTDVTVMNWGSGMRKDGLRLGANEAYVLKFTAPITMTSAYSSIYTLYSGATKLITISNDACGFNTPLNGSAACSMQQDPQMMTDEAGPTYSERTTTPYCRLSPGQTYYVNIRNSKPGVSPIQNSCTDAAGCTFSLSY